MPGTFIALEGASETRLTAAAQAIAARVRGAGRPVSLTREPSDGPVGGQLRQALTGRSAVHRLALPLLALGDRLDHLHRSPDGILAQLAAGQWVICTHYLLAAYRGFDAVTPLARLQRINAPCRWPDLVIYTGATCPAEHARYRQAIDSAQQARHAVVNLALETDLAGACAALVAPLLVAVDP